MSIAHRSPRHRATLLAAALCLATAIAPARAVAEYAEPVAPAAQADTLEQLAAQTLPAVVLLDVKTPTGTRQGSGFLVRSDGRIVTNQHVIDNAQIIRVKLASGDVYDQVSVLGTDERRDIAVIQIAGYNLPVLPLGNSDSVRIGLPVVLIGSPLGLENTVSTGIVSARRQQPSGFQLLQVSAPASVGSSGGPVISQTGEVVGVASTQIRQGQNLNFAVPVNYVRGLLDHLPGEPLVRLPARVEPAPPAEPMVAPKPNGLNRGLEFDLDEFRAYELWMERETADSTRIVSRVSYRRIDVVGDGKPRVERYAESQHVRTEDPKQPPRVVRRERSRTIVRVEDLAPISTRGEIGWWTGEGWHVAEYDLRFSDDRVRGAVRDSAGAVRELDTELPRGILLRETRDLAFATLAVSDLLGRSVELATLDPWTGELAEDRYDVLGLTEVETGSGPRAALRVNLATDLTNATAYFAADRPRVFLRREEADGSAPTVVTRVHIQGPGD